MAAFNEGAVIGQKIDSIFNTNYPKDRIELLVGSDCSTDTTNAIVWQKKDQYGRITFLEFTQRQGKANIMNQLLDLAQGEIIISTDANVFLAHDTVFNLVKFFKDESIGLVDSRMTNTGLKKEGISIQESRYISREVMIKYREGLIWGAMMGPFGGCFAIRKSCYSKVPKNYFMDDFYINMKVIGKGMKTINSLDAIVYEDVSNRIREEFRRKVRISIGNFQNLVEFKGLLWPPFSGVSFAFLSHKVLRWFGPFFIITALIMSIFLSFQSQFYQIVLAIQLFFFLLPLIDIFLRIINVHLLALRFVTHFISMNFALLFGLFKFLKGVSSNVWQPTQRNQ
jgi:cellulose synthase/poly-beta-1,6-N-acetylglucosamine synthase-like glycosyltransferase